MLQRNANRPPTFNEASGIGRGSGRLPHGRLQRQMPVRFKAVDIAIGALIDRCNAAALTQQDLCHAFQVANLVRSSDVRCTGIAHGLRGDVQRV